MVESILAVLAAGLKLWGSLESRKYVDKMMRLKKRYRDEWNKPESERSDAELDDITFEIKILADSFAAAVAKEQEING